MLVEVMVVAAVHEPLLAAEGTRGVNAQGPRSDHRPGKDTLQKSLDCASLISDSASE
jgi:hypothetical protein